MRVLITQPAQEAAVSAKALTARGHEPVLIPLVTVERETKPAINLASAQAFMAVSPEGVRALADLVGVRTFPIFVDSDLTAAEAKRAGFKEVLAAKDDTQDLARLVERSLKPANGALIYACSTAAPVNLPAMLGNMGFAVRPLPLYSIKRVDQLPHALREKLAGKAIDVALFMSPDEARAFVTLLQRDETAPPVAGLKTVTATPAIAAPLRALKGASITVAPASDPDSVWATLDGDLIDRVEEERLTRERHAREEEDRRRADEERRRKEEEDRAQRAREKEQAERAEKERIAAERAAAMKAAAAQAEMERLARLEEQRIRAEEERRKREDAERERQEKLAREAAERARIAAERAAREQAEREQREKERLERERLKAEGAAREKAEKERIAKERAAQELRRKEEEERERAERARLKAEEEAKLRAEKERVAVERAEQERLRKEQEAQAQAERARLKAEEEARLRAEKERIAAERAEHERLRKEQEALAQAERARLKAEEEAKLRAEKERIAAERAEAAHIAAEKAAAEKAEQDRRAKEAAARDEAERHRLAAERAAWEEAERIRLAAAQAERERQEAERIAREVADREQREKERAERERLAREEAERQRAEKQRIDLEEEKARQERGRIAREQAEAARIEREARAEAERAEKAQRAEAARIEKEVRAAAAQREKKAKAEAEREARERHAAEKAEAVRAAAARTAEEAEHKRRAREEAAAQKVRDAAARREEAARARVEQERLAAEHAERLRQEREGATRAKAERKRLAEEQKAEAKAERARLKAEQASTPGWTSRLWPFGARTAAPADAPDPRWAMATGLDGPHRETPPPETTSTDIPPADQTPLETSPAVASAAPSWNDTPMSDSTSNAKDTPEPSKDDDASATGVPLALVELNELVAREAAATRAKASVSKDTTAHESLADAKPAARSGGGRSAQMLAEDAADDRARDRLKNWGRGEAPEQQREPEPESFEPIPDAVAAPLGARRGPGRSIALFFGLATIVTAGLMTTDKWLPLVTGEAETPVATAPTPAPATIPAPAAPPAKPAEPAPAPRPPAATAPAQTQDANQTIANLMARVATLEAALGNAAQLDEVNKRVDMLEGRSADANSVLALADRVTALEHAGRSAADKRAVAVALTIAATQWRDAVVAGRPFVKEWDTVKALTGESATNAVFASYAHTGLPTLPTLRRDFDATAAAVIRAGLLPNGTSGWLRRALDRVLSVVTIRRIDTDVGDDAEAILVRAGRAVDAGNLTGATTELRKLTGAQLTAATAWIMVADARAAAEDAAHDTVLTAAAGLSAPATPTTQPTAPTTPSAAQ